MREIKFRAWNNVLNKMYSWNEFLDTNIKQTFIAPESTAMILMQYTGLKDKNGKEIYEGDIVRIQDDKYFTKEIQWKQGISGFIIKDVSLLDEYVIKQLEVIGNIYENAELLEDKE